VSCNEFSQNCFAGVDDSSHSTANLKFNRLGNRLLLAISGAKISWNGHLAAKDFDIDSSCYRSTKLNCVR
jgi:hypothetical protein